MLRMSFGLALGLALFAIASTARASNEWDDFWDNVRIDWHRNNEWPRPFVEADTAATNAPFAVMIANGWQRENLLGEEYFDDDSKRLTPAGRNRIRSILMQSPPEHRVIFVQRDLTEDVTARRLDAVQQAATALLPKGSLPDVVVSNMTPSYRSAEIVNSELKSYTNSVPPARLSGAKVSGAGAPSGGGAAPGGGGN